MEENWVSVFCTEKLYLAEIAKQVLEDNDIFAVVINKKDSSYNTFGEIEVYVDREQVIKASTLLDNIKA